VVKVGCHEIYSDNIIIDGHILGTIKFNPDHKSRHGTTMPLIIEIQHESIEQSIPIGTLAAERKRLLERKRYQLEHPIIKKPRKSLVYDNE